MFRSHAPIFSILVALFTFGSASAQPIALIPQGGLPPGLAMYNMFTSVALGDSEKPGSGVAYVQNVIGISDSSRAEAVFEYIRTAFDAGRRSSEARTRELCERDIHTAADLVRELEQRRAAHEAELTKVSLGIEKIVTDDEFAKLRRVAEAVAAGTGRKRIDYAAIYATGAVNVSAELKRLCAAN